LVTPNETFVLVLTTSPPPLPQILLTDTIDLQDQHAPSAKDHTRQPASPSKSGDGPPAPHQAASLRKASLDGYDLHVRSPRASQDLSNKELQLLHDTEPEEQDAVEAEQRLVGGVQGAAFAVGHHYHGADGQHELGPDGEEEEEQEDDMSDKISSSPSIEDGGYSIDPLGGAAAGSGLAPASWPPPRGDSLLHYYPSPSPALPAGTSDVLSESESSPVSSALARPDVTCTHDEANSGGNDRQFAISYRSAPSTTDPAAVTQPRGTIGFIVERTARRFFMRQKEDAAGSPASLQEPDNLGA
jgi:hypothetical protein